MPSNTKFKNQFKAYLASVTEMNGFQYIFNGKKTQNLTLIKEKFQDIFKQNNYGLWDDMESAGSNVFRSLGITNKAQFAQKVNNLDQELFKFIEIL